MLLLWFILFCTYYLMGQNNLDRVKFYTYQTLNIHLIIGLAPVSTWASGRGKLLKRQQEQKQIKIFWETHFFATIFVTLNDSAVFILFDHLLWRPKTMVFNLFYVSWPPEHNDNWRNLNVQNTSSLANSIARKSVKELTEPLLYVLRNPCRKTLYEELIF